MFHWNAENFPCRWLWGRRQQVGKSSDAQQVDEDNRCDDDQHDDWGACDEMNLLCGDFLSNCNSAQKSECVEHFQTSLKCARPGRCLASCDAARWKRFFRQPAFSAGFTTFRRKKNPDFGVR